VKTIAADWPQLKSHAFRFKDTLYSAGKNRDRRFIPLRLDDAPIKGSLAQFLYINWLCENRWQANSRLLSRSFRGD